MLRVGFKGVEIGRKYYVEAVVAKVFRNGQGGIIHTRRCRLQR